ncbi:MAG: tripartite tricarboxylate transporter substrate-binding protein [Pseudomonadota bacterium]
MKLTRRLVLGRLCAIAPVMTCGASSSSHATESSRCIVPAKAGGGFDVTCQLAQEMLTEQRALQLDYLPGGIGAVAYTRVVTERHAEPNTIVAFSSGSLLNLAQGKFGPYTERDVRWVAVIGADYGVVAVRKDSPFKDLRQLLAAMKAEPRALTFGAGGTIGSQDWFKSALLVRSAGGNARSFRFVAFEGGGDALLALAGGHVSAFAGDAAEVGQHVAKGGSVRLLAVLSEQRLQGAFADVPTAREQGVDVVWQTARGFYMGGRVNDDSHRAWVSAFQRAMADERYAKRLASHGLFPLALTGAELERFVAIQMNRFRTLATEFEVMKR